MLSLGSEAGCVMERIEVLEHDGILLYVLVELDQTNMTADEAHHLKDLIEVREVFGGLHQIDLATS